MVTLVHHVMNIAKLKILVCYYKDIIIDTRNNEAYFNIQCGRDDTGIVLDMTGDNTGDNISAKNRYWSEITGLYWAWKHMDKVDYVGLCSYRRFFNFKKDTIAPIRIINFDEVEEIKKIKVPDMDKIFDSYDIVIPKPYLYAYPISKVCNMNYAPGDFDTLEKVINELSPEYNAAYQKVFYQSNSMIGHNMFILKWEDFNEYCQWVFDVLFEIERRIDPTNYPINQVRVFGYMHEILLGVYIEKKQFRKYYSQLTWITKNSKGFKFNNWGYQILAKMYYYGTKLLRAV